jgi:hypothetical protein
VGSLARPSSYAVFNCSVPPFVTTNDAMGNLSARLAAALNRGTVAANPNQPGATASGFYRVSTTNHYARLIHASTAGGAGGTPSLTTTCTPPATTPKTGSWTPTRHD